MTIFIYICRQIVRIFFFSFSLILLSACVGLPSRAVQEYNHCVSLSQTGAREESIRLYRELLKVWPYYDKARYNLILLELANGEYALAEENLAYLQKRKSDNVSVMKLQAYSLYLQGKKEEALSVYKALVLRLPLDSAVLYNLAYLFWHTYKDEVKSRYYLRRLELIHEEGLFKEKEWVKELGKIY